MSRSWLPDLIGPVSVTANGGTAVGIRKRVLNLLSSGAVVADNVAKRRIDLTLPDPAWSAYSYTLILTGEDLPTSANFGTADLIRLDASSPGSIVTGFDSGPDPTKLVKFIANVGSVAITLQPPASPLAGKQYFSGAAYTLAASNVVRVAWDSITRVYRVIGTAPVVTASLIVLDGDPLALSGDHILNPT